MLSARRWLGAAAADWSIIVATFALVGWLDHPLAYAIAIFPLGSRQQGLGALFHDAAHRLVSRNRAVNDTLGALLAAWPLGLTLHGYRRYHLSHHKSLGTDRDPEIGHKQLLRHWPLPMRGAHLLHFVSDLLGAGLPHLAAAGRMTRPARWPETAGFLLFWAALLTIGWSVEMVWVPILWVASIATTFWSGVRLRIWTEHLGTTGTHRITMHPMFEAIVMPHQIGFHWEHHHFPTVPFYNLRALRKALPSPAPIQLVDLFRAFRRAPKLRSGEIADVIGRSAT